MDRQSQASTFQQLASYALVIALLLLMHWGSVVMGLTPVAKGEMPDTDTYMRLVRIEELATSHNWFDSKIERMNAPYGDTLNWTRPLDVMVIALALPLMSQFHLTQHDALYWAGAILPPILQVVLGLCVAWLAVPFLPKVTRPLLLLFVCVQPLVFIYNMIGRPDHQTLLMISATLMLGFVTRGLLLWQSPLRAGLWAGLWAGFGLWVSTEFEFAFAVATATLALMWLWQGERHILEVLEGLAIGFLLLVVAGVLAERGAEWNSIRELDKISLSQLIGAVINCSLWGMVAWLYPLAGAGITRRALALAGMLGAAAFAVVILAPELLRGPAGDIDPRVMSGFFLKIHEMRAIWPTSIENTGYALLCLGIPLLGVLLWLWSYRRERLSPWLPVVTTTLAFTVFAFFHARFAQFAEPFGALLLLAAVMRIGQRMAERPLLLRAGVQAGLLVAPLLLAAAVFSIQPVKAGQDGTCAIKPIAAQIDALPDGIIMAPLNLGPEILYFTHQRVVAGPYHRNTRGILDSIDFFSTTPDDRAQEILRQRGVKYVLACPEQDMQPESRLARLLAGDAPNWLKPHDLKDAGTLKLFELR